MKLVDEFWKCLLLFSSKAFTIPYTFQNA